MKNNKILAAFGAAAVCATLSIAYYARISTAQEQAAAETNGVVNPESAKAGLTTRSVPELSERTFKPAPSSITGSYTEPVVEKGRGSPDLAEKKSDK